MEADFWGMNDITYKMDGKGMDGGTAHDFEEFSNDKFGRCLYLVNNFFMKIIKGNKKRDANITVS